MTGGGEGADEQDPLIGALMRLAQADFSARAPRTFDGGRQDTLAFLVNTVSEELARVVQRAQEHEAVLQRSVETFAEVLSAHAAANFEARAPRTEDGSPLDVLAFMINNTGAETGRLFEERNRAFDELSHAKETEAVSRARSAFLANVSHELRTPLTLILGPLHRLLTDREVRLDEGVRADLHVVLRNASRLARMVNDLLDFTKADEGKLVVRWQRVDLAQVVADTVRDLRPIADDRGIALSAELTGLPEGVVDRRMFEKIVVNLISNALKFTGSGGSVAVRGKTNADQIVLQVADTGIGIAPDDLDRVFDRFHQVDSSQARRFEGSGLGLTLVREFARAMGGNVTVHSALHAGSTFEVLLPLKEPLGVVVLPADAEAPASDRPLMEVAGLSTPQEPSRAAAPADEGQPFVLLAEDNADMRGYLLDVLEGEFEVHATADGQEALEALEHRVPDVIVSDVMMPRLDGLALVAKVKADPRLAAVPIVLLTARAGSTSTVEGLDVGADDYLAKPFEPRELKARVRAAARLRQKTKDLALTLDELQTTKTLVLRMGQVGVASRLLGQAGREITAALREDAPDRAAALAERLVSIQALVEPPPADRSCDLLALVAEALGLPEPGGDPVVVEGEEASIARALGLVFDEAGVHCDGTATLRLASTEAEGQLLVVEVPHDAASSPDFSAPLPESADLQTLERAAGHQALLASGVETSAFATDGRLSIRLSIA